MVTNSNCALFPYVSGFNGHDDVSVHTINSLDALAYEFEHDRAYIQIYTDDGVHPENTWFGDLLTSDEMKGDIEPTNLVKIPSKSYVGYEEPFKLKDPKASILKLIELLEISLEENMNFLILNELMDTADSEPVMAKIFEESHHLSDSEDSTFTCGLGTEEINGIYVIAKNISLNVNTQAFQQTGMIEQFLKWLRLV